MVARGAKSWFVPTLALIPMVLGLPGCGAGTELLNRKSPPIISTSISFGLGNSPCTSGGVKLKLANTENSLFLDSGDDVDDERIQRALDNFRLRLPNNVLSKIDGSEDLQQVTHYNVSFSYQDIPVCDMNGRIHVYQDRIDYTALPVRHPLAGQKIDDRLLNRLGNPWPETSKVLATLRIHLNLKSHDVVQITSIHHCAALDRSVLTPLLDMRVEINGIPYDVLGDHQKIRKVASGVLFANGRASFLKDNPKFGKLQVLDLTDLADDVFTLTGLRFASSRKDGTPMIEHRTREYIVSQSDPSFDEVNSYANAERVATWLQQPEKKYTLDCLPVTIELAPSIVTEGKNEDGSNKKDTNPDNARYYPAQKGTGPGPKIVVGPGGKDLKALRLDYDVLAHEMGHHVLSRYLGTSPFSTVVIQEGVSDFLVYAQTGDGCLAESVCPEGDRAGCSEPGVCLRTANNNRIIDPFDLHETGKGIGRSPYEPAEILSSVLWNVGSRSEVGLEKLARIILQALPYFKKESSFEDFFQAVYKADLQMTGGATNCLIEKEAKDRGFEEILRNIPCTDFKTR